MTDLDLFLDHLERTHEPIRASRLTAVSDLDEGQMTVLQRRWTDVPPERRRAVVRLMNDVTEDHVELNFEQVLRFLLADPDGEVRAEAIRGLWECTDPKLINPLILALRTDSEEFVREAAATALGQFVLRGELGELRDRYRERLEMELTEVAEDSNESAVVRRRAVESLGPINKERVSMLIESAYESDEEQLVLGSLYAMGRSADARWIPILEEETQHLEPEHRYEAAVALGEIEDPSAVPALVNIVEDPDAEVRIAAIDSLGKVGGKDAERALRRLLQHPSDDVREAAADALSAVEVFGTE